jgi:hypothetical protein
MFSLGTIYIVSVYIFISCVFIASDLESQEFHEQFFAFLKNSIVLE